MWGGAAREAAVDAPGSLALGVQIRRRGQRVQSPLSVALQPAAHTHSPRLESPGRKTALTRHRPCAQIFGFGLFASPAQGLFHLRSAAEQVRRRRTCSRGGCTPPLPPPRCDFTPWRLGHRQELVPGTSTYSRTSGLWGGGGGWHSTSAIGRTRRILVATAGACATLLAPVRGGDARPATCTSAL